ncbi:IS110 family transposase [Roseibium sp.]
MSEYVGFDVSKEETSFCVKDRDGKVLVRGKVATDPVALFETLKEHCVYPERIVMETGTWGHWLVRELRCLGVDVDLIDARQAHAVMKLQHNKTDANDADLLAEIARTGFCRPVAVKSEAAQMDRTVLKARQHLIRQRRDTENAIRGLLGAFGHRLPKGVSKFEGRVQFVLEVCPALSGVVGPLLKARAAVTRCLEALDGEVRERAAHSPACRLLMTAPGVGPVTALAFASTIDDPARFGKSRSVGAYAGLTARRNQSGEMDWSGRISKHGDTMLRSLLFEAASSLLTVVRKAHPLKDWARRIRKRSSHKKACVALARKLAVILHKMLASGEAFRWPEAAQA